MNKLIILAILIMTTACSIQKQTPIAETISYTSSKCFGKCTEQSITINENLEMQYEGKKNVENIGSYVATIKKSDYNNLLRTFKAAEFSKMNSSYMSNLRDLQKFTMTLGNKTISYQKRKAPEELVNLQKEIQELISNTKWTAK